MVVATIIAKCYAVTRAAMVVVLDVVDVMSVMRVVVAEE